MGTFGVLGEGGLPAKAVSSSAEGCVIVGEPRTFSRKEARGTCMVACRYGFDGDAQDSRTIQQVVSALRLSNLASNQLTSENLLPHVSTSHT